MDITSSVATSRLVAQQRVMDVIADNIANANTSGFKAERVQFSDWLIRADAYRQPVRPWHHKRRFLHGPHIKWATADAQWALWPDARRYDR
jgi:flagellar basal body rod protein FlgG